MRLAGLIIARNEAERIEGAVRSLGFSDEVVVVDGGSSDDTVRRARAAGARVVENPWPGFAAQRRFALEQTNAEWIFFLDADERVPQALAEEILRETESGGAEGYRVLRRSNFLGREMRWGAWRNDAPLRLARRVAVRVPERAIHERLEVDGPVGRLRNFLIHDAQPDFPTVAEKFRAYLAPSVEEILAKGRPVRRAEVFVRPAASFLRDYVLRLGFLDGWRGWVLAKWNAASVLARYAEARRRQEAE